MKNKKHYGLKYLSNFFPSEAKKLLRKRGFFELELLKNWDQIIDAKYSKLTAPIRVKASNMQGDNKTSTLFLKVDTSVGFAVQHDLTKIIKKINSFFGYTAIDKISIIQDKFTKKSIESNDNNELFQNTKTQNKSFDELKDYPTLKENFEKIVKKVSKN